MFLRKKKREVSKFLNTGFHGDRNLQFVVDELMKDCELFIETGTNVGSTLSFVAKKYPTVSCLSCEPHKESFLTAKENTTGLGNVELFNITSERFIKELKQMEVGDKKVLFWLDAHGYGFKWPIKKEVEFITNFFPRAHILIDDFKVPGMDAFKWDEYKGQECSYDYIKNCIPRELDFSLYYPSKEERTSDVHPLTGWGLITYGMGFSPSNDLEGILREGER